MKARIALAATLLAATPAFAATPLIAQYDAAKMTKDCDALVAKARKDMAAMGAKKSAAGVFDEWNRLQIEIEDVAGPTSLIGNVHPDKAVRDATEPCQEKLTSLNTDLLQDEKIYARVKAAKPANAHQKKLRKDLLEAFEDSGVALAPDKRKRSKEITEKLETLRQAFDRNIRDDKTTVTMTPAEMEGLPEGYLTGKAKDDKGNYVLKLDSPTYFPFMASARSGAARERYYRAQQQQGGEGNLKILGDMFVLRQELAGLYGLPDYASYAMRRKMVGTPAVVNKFLADVKAAVTGLELKELGELRAEKAKELGQPVDAVKIERWDVIYYQEKIRKSRYAIDQEELRKYFPTDKAIAYTFLVSETLYGIKIQETPVKAWHEDVRHFDVVDAKTGKYLSSFYFDLYPRDGKYTHAAAWAVRGASKATGRTPMTVLVTNLDRKGLNQREMETLFHEFGHVLHGVLSTADYNPQAGTATLQDFVEAPSQMFEEWVRRPEPLALMKTVCAECPQLSREQIERIDAARRYGQGIKYQRQWEYGAFDMRLSQKPQDVLQAWAAVERETPLGYVEGTMFPAQFGHLAQQYAAGYYGYMWSEVLALDMLSAFKGKLMDPAVGKRYRDTILANGAQEEPMDLVRRFLGRAPSSDAFFAEITGKR
ncbi:hypothetical protein BWI17_12960 [Betaproteobacteria bacterium GR16-43]|nr:hypothetical protein BWI17_12960 [Betaproteobacteria bacterium GR16-43]